MNPNDMKGEVSKGTQLQPMVPQRLDIAPGPSPSGERAMRLDVLIPSHNRGAQLERTVRSVMRAEQAPALRARITVICNDCTDDSHQRLARLQAERPDSLRVVDEPRRGKSVALNTGIAATSGDLVGMIDDDEEVESNWLRVIAESFQDERLEYIGGPYLACWETPPPPWAPDDYPAVLGSADNGPVARDYDRHFPGILKGGNAVIRRRTLRRVGPYAEQLGPGTLSRLLSCEDEEMYLRLLEDGARGRYVPELLIRHHVSIARFTASYFRRWCFWRGVSRGLMDRAHPLPVAYLAGVPRFLVGRAARSVINLGRGLVRGQARKDRFGQELRLWDLAGYFYGRNLYPLAHLFLAKKRRSSETVDEPAPVQDDVDDEAPGEEIPRAADRDVAITA